MNIFFILLCALAGIRKIQSVPLPPLSINGTYIYAGTKPVELKGINWFGFNNKQTMVDGLWAGGTSFATDFSTILYKLKALGFNTVRLPFTFTDLTLPPKSFVKECTYTNVATINKLTKAKPPLPSASIIHPSTKAGVCNTYLKKSSIAKERLLWATSAFIDAGFYVILDYHPMGTEDIPNNPALFHKHWEDLWYSLISTYPNTRGRIILDLMNEPDSTQLKWKYVTKLYIPLMNNIYKKDQHVLFMVEGTGQVGYNLNWGDGFVTNPNIIQQHKIDDATPFFKELMKHSVKNNLIISPHLYGPSISKSKVYKGKALINRFYHSFGYLDNPGYCQGKNCHRFPIVIGEIGSMFKNPQDIEFLNDFAKYQTQPNKKNKNHWAWWAYNENSGDTGGIVKNNWQDIDWFKVNWLKNALNL